MKIIYNAMKLKIIYILMVINYETLKYITCSFVYIL